MSYADERLVEISGLSKSFASQPVLRDLDLSLPPGVHALLGPNGAGKTTLVSILSTLLRPDAGRVRVLGLDPVRDRRRLQSMITLTGQHAALDGQLTGIENLEMLGGLFGLERATTRRRAAELIERFDLGSAARRRAATYSGGMRRKLDLAASLIADPRLILLDEPTTGLDTRSRQALWEEIRALAAAGTSVLLTTQYLDEADVLADRIVVLHGGRIVAGGTAAELKERVGGSTIELHDAAGRLVEEIPTRGDANDVARQLADVAEVSPQASVLVRRPSLDEVFLTLTGGPARDDRHQDRNQDRNQEVLA
ncbi:ABC transporter ATP-binding protein [Nesterenkonia sp. F]|uniref:ABC transporter ATP-binding protein n=1 Tax=Nesterenkonia sp. F TaxID=795955 RepID=UPI000255C8AE|nr:ATP-binding cassette domain-containing protein [Nesterenkonia sp. F]